MQIRNLSQVLFSDLIECFLKAFEDYFVPMPTDELYYKNRWKAACINFDLSFGVFDEDRLIAFMLICIDERNGNKIAFNTGTGVLPAYRGLGLVYKMYEVALPEFKKEGVNLCSLEVIQENSRAISVYQKLGFEIVRGLNCFSGQIGKLSSFDIHICPFDILEKMNLIQSFDSNYSWDNQYNSLINHKVSSYEVFHRANSIGYFILNESNGQIAQCEVWENGEANWKQLFIAISSLTQEFKINNVTDFCIVKLNYLNGLGLKNTINQFQMEMKI